MTAPRRTFEDGKIAQRLDAHDAHLDKINGSMAEVAAKLSGVELQMQRLADNAIAASATAIATALALEKAENARRVASDSDWSPWHKIITIGLAIVAVAGLYLAWTHR